MSPVLTEHMGIFKDMLDTVSSDGDREPVFSLPLRLKQLARVNIKEVILDETPEIFESFVLWLFHNPQFVVTKGKD